MSKGKAKDRGEWERPETKAEGTGRREHLGEGALGCKFLFHTIPCARAGGDHVNGQPPANASRLVFQTLDHYRELKSAGDSDAAFSCARSPFARAGGDQVNGSPPARFSVFFCACPRAQGDCGRKGDTLSCRSPPRLSHNNVRNIPQAFQDKRCVCSASPESSPPFVE